MQLLGYTVQPSENFYMYSCIIKVMANCRQIGERYMSKR